MPLEFLAWNSPPLDFPTRIIVTVILINITIIIVIITMIKLLDLNK